MQPGCRALMRVAVDPLLGNVDFISPRCRFAIINGVFGVYRSDGGRQPIASPSRAPLSLRDLLTPAYVSNRSTQFLRVVSNTRHLNRD